MGVTKPSARRFEKRAKKMAARELPNSLDTATLSELLRDAGLDAEKGLGRVLTELVRSSQGNFDHMQSELERYTQYHNEHAEETNFLKDELLPHEHSRFTTGQAVGRGVWHSSFVGSAPINLGFYFATNRFVPVFIEEACTVEYLAVSVTTLGTSDIRLAIYAGDNEGNYPGSLIHDAGLVDGSVEDFAYTGAGVTPFDAHLGGGRWYWFAGQEDPAAGTTVEVEGFDSEGGLDVSFETNMANWWPFPSLTEDIERTGILSVSTTEWAMDADPPAWAGDIDTDFSYSKVAPLIGYRVR